MQLIFMICSYGEASYRFCGYSVARPTGLVLSSASDSSRHSGAGAILNSTSSLKLVHTVNTKHLESIVPLDAIQ
jgi:hypothetical protein